ncbi:MAG: hypoxanthine phosphoribosyltransferase, partial [Pirellulaceae bacterium]|nr:hypoxanthine phosphoribosyltransferase [Pirellulaceae bacterium]
METLFDSPTLAARIEQLATTIAEDYSTRPPVFIGILNGAVQFMMALIGAFPSGFAETAQYDFVNVSSYDGHTSRGSVEIGRRSAVEIADRDVIIVDGIVDTGLSLNQLLLQLQMEDPRSVKVCVLLNKPARRSHAVEIHYQGFEIDDHFVVGFGMDYNQHFRCLPQVAVFEQPGKR